MSLKLIKTYAFNTDKADKTDTIKTYVFNKLLLYIEISIYIDIFVISISYTIFDFSISKIIFANMISKIICKLKNIDNIDFFSDIDIRHSRQYKDICLYKTDIKHTDTCTR